MNATISGIRLRIAGLPSPSAMPIAGSTKKQRTSATRPNSRFTLRSPPGASASLGLENLRDPHAAERGESDSGEADHDAERLVDVLPADRAQEHRFAREIGAGGVQLLADQRVVAGRDEERELGGS